MNLYEEYETSPDLERKGVEIPIGDMVWTLRHAGGANKKYEKALDTRSRRFRDGPGGKLRMEDEQASQMLYELYADHIVVDWHGVKDRDGKELQFSRQNCVRIFTDLPKFFLVIKRHAEDIEFYRAKVLENEAGNSQPSSNTD